MSRSYKKIPCYKGYNRGMKKHANRYVRRNYLIVPSGMAYKKLICPWIIYDYKCLESFSSYKRSWKSGLGYRGYTDAELYRKWYKYYKMK